MPNPSRPVAGSVSRAGGFGARRATTRTAIGCGAPAVLPLWSC